MFDTVERFVLLPFGKRTQRYGGKFDLPFAESWALQLSTLNVWKSLPLSVSLLSVHGRYRCAASTKAAELFIYIMPEKPMPILGRLLYVWNDNDN